MSEVNRPKNPKTGRQDGIRYTFGDSAVCMALMDHLERTSSIHLVGKISRILGNFTEGLELLSTLPKKKPRTAMILMWKKYYHEVFNQLLTKEQGQTYLLNLVKTKYLKIFPGKRRQHGS